MSPRRDPVPRARSAVQWLSGILLLGVLAGGVVAAGVKLWQNIDIQRITRSASLREPHVVPTALPPNDAAVAARSYSAALYFSHTSAAFFPDPDYYPALMDRWESLVVATGGRVVRISSAEAIDALDSSIVLVAPAAVCLGDRERSALQAHAERGGGLVITWAVAARDSSCTWVGWQGVAVLAGSQEVRELQQREALYLAVPSDIPLSPGFDPGTRVELRFESQLAAVTVGTRLFWADWALNVAPADGAEAVNAAAVTNWTDAGGRVAWFGFRIGQGARAVDEQRLIRLLQNGLRWTAGLPTAEIFPWPGGRRSALMLAQDVESQFTNALALVDVARRKSAPVTFFVVSQLALDYPETADSLLSVGEVGSQTSDHTVLVDLPYPEQRTRLRRSWTEIRGWTGDSAFGLHPPEERFDENTLRAWRDAGGSYLVGVNEARTASPEVFETSDGNIVLLPRIVKDDYNVLVQEGALRSKHLTDAYLEGMAKVRALGGLAVLSLRSQVGGDPGRVRVIAEVIDSARAVQDWWLASGREIATWWLSRRQATVGLREVASGDLELEVVAPASARLAGAWLTVLLPQDGTDWIPSLEGQPVRYARTPWGMRIPLPDLGSGQQIVIRLERSS